MAHTHSIPSLDEQFEFTAESKRRLTIGIIAGVVLVGIGAYLAAKGGGGHEHVEAAHGAAGHAAHGEAAHAAAGGHHEYKWTTRLWANVWVNSVYFTGAAVIGMFFIAYNYLAQAGWSAVFKRIPEALPAFLPITGVIMLITFFVAGHDLFHWTHEGLYEVGGPEYDPIIAGKKGFLNTPFFVGRMIFYFVAWYALWRIVRKFSLDEDLE
ncbi:MAG: quinol:cytochrome C oxidoreductase, partial [Sphingobacteriales bacterium]